MRHNNDLLREAIQIINNAQRLDAWRERLEFYNWHRRQTGARYVFPLPITKAR